MADCNPDRRTVSLQTCAHRILKHFCIFNRNGQGWINLQTNDEEGLLLKKLLEKEVNLQNVWEVYIPYKTIFGDLKKSSKMWWGVILHVGYLPAYSYPAEYYVHSAL